MKGFVTLLLSIVAMSMGQIQIYSPSSSAVHKGTPITFRWATGAYNGTGYDCPNQPTVPGTQLAEFLSSCSLAGTAQTDALANFNSVYGWADVNTQIMEDPLVAIVSYVRNTLQPQAVNLLSIGVNISQFPQYPADSVLPSSVRNLTEFFYGQPLGSQYTYPFSQLTSDVFGRANQCNGFAKLNATGIVQLFLTYLINLESDTSYINEAFGDNYAIYGPFYSAIQTYYNNVLSPKAAQIQSCCSIDISQFPPRTEPSINLASQPTAESYDTGDCDNVLSIDVSISPVTLEIFAGTDVDTNTSTIVSIGGSQVYNTGTQTYTIPCSLETDDANTFVFFRVSTATYTSYIQLTAIPCSAALSTVGVVVYALMLMLSML